MVKPPFSYCSMTSILSYTFFIPPLSSCMVLPSADLLMEKILRTTFPTFSKMSIRNIIIRHNAKDYPGAKRMLPPFGDISIVQVAQIYQTLQRNNTHFVINLCKELLKAKRELDQSPTTYFYPGGIPMKQSTTVIQPFAPNALTPSLDHAKPPESTQPPRGPRATGRPPTRIPPMLICPTRVSPTTRMIFHPTWLLSRQTNSSPRTQPRRMPLLVPGPFPPCLLRQSAPIPSVPPIHQIRSTSPGLLRHPQPTYLPMGYQL